MGSAQKVIASTKTIIFYSFLFQVQAMLDIASTFPAMRGTSLQASSTSEATALTQDEKANEVKATRAKSSRGQIKYTAEFTNRWGKWALRDDGNIHAATINVN